MKHRKIAYIVSMSAGLEAFIYREVEEMERLGHKLVLFAIGYKKADVYSAKKHWPYCSFTKLKMLLHAPVLLIRALFKPGLFLEALKDKGLVDLLIAYYFVSGMKKHNIEQLHAHFGDHKFFIGYYCKRLLKLPLTVTIHAHEFYTNPNEKLFAKALLAADKVLPIAEKWCKKLVSEYGLAQSCVELNRLFVDTALYKKSNHINIIAVGRFTERKGFQYLIEALALITQENIHLWLIGFGEYDIATLIKKFNVDNKVTVFSKMNQAQLRAMYQCADILCVPSITTEREGAEGIPVVLMEGMACELPVIATDCGASTELVEEIIVAQRSAQDIADAINLLAGNADLRISQGKKNREKVLREFSVTNVEKFSKVLDKVYSNHLD